METLDLIPAVALLHRTERPSENPVEKRAAKLG